jgi:hypothetical protein
MMRHGIVAILSIFVIASLFLPACSNQYSPEAPPANLSPTTAAAAQPTVAVKAAEPPPPPLQGKTIADPPAPPVQAKAAAPLNIAPPPEPAARDAQQVNPRIVATQNPFVQLVPEAAHSPGPDWLRQGTRITYDVKSATIPRDRDDQGAAGGGLIQVDVVGVDNLATACSVKLYLDIGLNGTYHPNIVADSYGLVAAGEYWVNPALLKNIERVANDELKVMRMPTKIGERTYNAVRFEYTQGLAKYVWMLDEASGVILFHSSLQGTDETARKNSSILTLAAVRQINLPWSTASTPGWVTAGGITQYNGTLAVAPFGTSPQRFPISLQAEVKSVNKRWSQYQFRDLGPVASLPSNRVTGVGQIFDAMWLPAEALQNIRDGQQLDRDPVTGSTITVSRRAGIIAVTESGRAYRTELGYDERSGAQTTVQQEKNSGVVVTTIQLQRSQR